MTAVQTSLNVTPTFLDPRTDFIEQVRPYAASPSTRPVTREPHQIFAQLEEDNERRAQQSLEPADLPQEVYGRVASPAPPAAPTMVSLVRDRRRGSISVSRFGLVCLSFIFVMLGPLPVRFAICAYHEIPTHTVTSRSERASSRLCLTRGDARCRGHSSAALTPQARVLQSRNLEDSSHCA